LALIEREYPILKTECLRQREYLEGRLKGHAHSRYKHDLTINGGQQPFIQVTDLIGASQESSLVLAQKEKEIATLKQELEASKSELGELRKMTYGSVYDELNLLRSKQPESEQLRGEVGRYQKFFAEIQAAIVHFNQQSVPIGREPFNKYLPEYHAAMRVGDDLQPQRRLNIRYSDKKIRQVALNIMTESREFLSSRALSNAIEKQMGCRLKHGLWYYLSELIEKGLVDKQGERAGTAYRYHPAQMESL
jgi:hypothetical protein